MVENKGQESKSKLPIAKQEDVEFALELADAEDTEALERANDADDRQEKSTENRRKAISAYFKNENDAEGAALKLKTLRGSDVRVEKIGDDTGNIIDRASIPLDSAFLMLGGMNMSGGLANSTVGAMGTGAPGMGLLAMREPDLHENYSPASHGKYNILLTGYADEEIYERALQVIRANDGEV